MNNLSENIPSTLRQVSQLFQNGDHDKAKSVLEQLHRTEPENEIVIQACISLYKRLNDNKAAIDFAVKLLAIKPDDLNLVTSLASWCIQEGQIDKAIDCYQNFISQNTQSAQAYYQLAIIYKRKLQFEQAINMLESAISNQYQPLEDCYLNLSLIYRELRQEALAIEFLQKLVKLNPEHLIGQLNLATLYESSGDNDLAINIYNNILQVDPTFVEALVRLSYATKFTDTDVNLLKKLNRRIRSSGTSAAESEGLHYALAKAMDDMAKHQAAFNAAKTANDLNQKRLGNYDTSGMENFVNNSIQKFCSKWMDSHRLSTNAEPIFIIGHFRSGSTLIEQILSGHSSVTSLGEVDYFLRYFHQQPESFWNTANDNSPQQLQSLSQGYTELVANLSQDSNRITDKRPENILFLGLIKKLIPGAKFIHTRRNLLDNAISVYFQQLNDLSKFATSLESFAHYDSQCEKLMTHWKGLFGGDIYEVYYEDLVSEPKKMVEKILAFLKLDWQDDCLNFSERKNFVRTASVSQVRNEIYSTSVGRGSRYFSFLSEADQQRYKQWVE